MCVNLKWMYTLEVHSITRKRVSEYLGYYIQCISHFFCVHITACSTLVWPDFWDYLLQKRRRPKPIHTIAAQILLPFWHEWWSVALVCRSSVLQCISSCAIRVFQPVLWGRFLLWDPSAVPVSVLLRLRQVCVSEGSDHRLVYTSYTYTQQHINSNASVNFRGVFHIS